jgi:hypothetical protein
MHCYSDYSTRRTRLSTDASVVTTWSRIIFTLLYWRIELFISKRLNISSNDCKALHRLSVCSVL